MFTHAIAYFDREADVFVVPEVDELGREFHDDIIFFQRAGQGRVEKFVHAQQILAHAGDDGRRRCTFRIGGGFERSRQSNQRQQHGETPRTNEDSRGQPRDIADKL